jgi:hypothetical protein
MCEQVPLWRDSLVSGAPNFRHLPDWPIIGVGQPTVYGIRTILNMTTKFQPSLHVHWINLREEPVVYLNSRPFSLREKQHPNRNLSDLSGMLPSRIVQLENLIKEDCLREAPFHHGNLLVHQENTHGVTATLEAGTFDFAGLSFGCRSCDGHMLGRTPVAPSTLQHYLVFLLFTSSKHPH